MMTMVLKEKARYGTPCNSCGQCCQASLCPLASALLRMPLGAPGPCPMLEFDSRGESSCGVVRRPGAFAPVKTRIHGAEAMRKAALYLIGAGFGCDGLTEDEPDDPVFRARMTAEAESTQEMRYLSMRAWGLHLSSWWPRS